MVSMFSWLSALAIAASHVRQLKQAGPHTAWQQPMHLGFTAGISPHKPEEMNQTKEMHITN